MKVFCLIGIFATFFFFGCSSEYKMNTFESWCAYQIKEIKADVIKTDRNGIRSGFVFQFNESLMKRLKSESEGKANIDKIVWQEGKTLCVRDLFGATAGDPFFMINQIETGIEHYKKNKIDVDGEKCHFGAIVGFFDSVRVYALKSYDPESQKWEYIKFGRDLKTGRKEYFLKSRIPGIRKMVEQPDF